MNKQDLYEELRFARNIPTIPRPLGAIGVGLAFFTVAWLSIPKTTLYWLLLPAVATVAWAASYGWRQALTSLIAFLSRLQSME